MIKTMELGDRMKAYERVSDWRLSPKSWVIIRVDGRAFHSYLRRARKPFDDDVIRAMQEATWRTAKDMHGIKLSYTQSDEASFAISTTDSIKGEDWLGYRYSKLVSLTASAFTVHFNQAYPRGGAQFDSRAFSIPETEVGNYFVWRQKDWERNSLIMLSRAHFSHKELVGKKTADMHEMLWRAGINWSDLPAVQKTGTFFVARDPTPHCERWLYDDVTAHLQPVTIEELSPITLSAAIEHSI